MEARGPVFVPSRKAVSGITLCRVAANDQNAMYVTLMRRRRLLLRATTAAATTTTTIDDDNDDCYRDVDDNECRTDLDSPRAMLSIATHLTNTAGCEPLRMNPP